MSSKATKVRLVRCPKCWGILPELPDVPVYKCGGCNATLKAKNRKGDGKTVSSEACDYDPALKDELKRETEIKDLDVYSRKANLSSEETYNQVESDEFHRKQCGDDSTHEISSSSEINSHVKEESSSEAGGNNKAEHDNGGYSNSGSQSPDTQAFSGGSSPVYTAQRSYGEMLTQMNNTFSNREPETSGKILTQDPYRIKSSDTVQSAEPTNYNINSDEDTDEARISGRLGGVLKSSATRNSNAYDGSVSSYDGWDDQISDQHQYQYKRPFLESQRVAEFVSNEGQPTREDFGVTNKMTVYVEEQNQAIKFSSMSLNEKHSPSNMGGAQLDPIRYDSRARQQLNSCGSEGLHQAPHFKVLERDEFLHEEHFYQNCNSADYDHVGPSNYRQEEFMGSSSLYPETLDYVECDQMELLRKVDELRDQLNKSCAHQRTANESFLARCTQRDKQWPLYHNRKLHDQENLQRYNSSYSQQPPVAFRTRKSMTHHYGCSQMSFSGMGYHEDWQCLQNQEPPSVCCDGGLHRARRGNMCYNPYSSSSSSPHRRVHSNCPCRGCDLQPFTHHPIDMTNEVEKLYHKERRQAMKRHYRPIAGGAPFITCYSCFELLHIPADFLHASKRCHRLQCGSCSKVLTFSLHKRIHIVPYSPKSVVPPPSEVDNRHAATSTRNSSRANDCAQGDPMSYSEDYGLSTCKSCSTESETAFVSPGRPALPISTVDRIQPSSSSYTKLPEEKKKRLILSHSDGKHKSPMEVQILVGSPSNEMAQQTGSPLHRLMGYSSPSEMITG